MDMRFSINRRKTGDRENRADHKTAIPGGRVLSIDIFRGFCLAYMVPCHFMVCYGNEAAAGTLVYFVLNDTMGDWGAAAFLMMMGMSQALSAERMANQDNRLLFKRALLRGGYLFVVGLAMQLAAWGPDELWSWDVLTLMGAATVVLYFCRFAPSWVLVVLIALLATASPLLRGMPSMTSEWWAGGFSPTPFISEYLPGMFVNHNVKPDFVWQLGSIVTGFFLSGAFPVFPWLLFSILGLVLGRRIVNGKMKSDIGMLLLVGILLTALGFGGAYAGRFNPSSVVDGFVCPFSFYPDSFTMIAQQAGMCLIIFAILYYAYDVKKRPESGLGPLARIFRRTSNFSLSFYVLHWLLVGWSLALLYVITGRHLVGDLMTAGPALVCGLAALAALEALLILWEKSGSKYSLEWLLAGITARVVKGYRRGV